MATIPNTPTTEFTRDVLGRYVCNGLDEALASADTSRHADARPFDVIVIGGGSFGAVLASRLFNADKSHQHRILVLEGGPMLLPEHVQNLPPGLGDALGEVNGTPWRSDSPQPWNRQFSGLTYCLGGRSLHWGGWSPYFIESELPSPPWPTSVVKDLSTPVLPHAGANPESYQDVAARAIGTAATNDFVFGALHFALRDRLFSDLQARPHDPRLTLTGQRGTLTAEDDLEAPLAVQSGAPRPGFFPFNKFNGVQLLLRASRLAYGEARQSAAGGPDRVDVKKRLMIAANIHVIRLERDGGSGRIVRVHTNRGVVDVPGDGQVFLALGTIENTRLALNTLPNAHSLIGRNLMAHLRSNLTIRVKRAAFGDALDAAKHPELRDLQVSALFVKGIFDHADGAIGHFHLQITASGVGVLGTDSEAELFKKIPDIDTLDRFQTLTDEWIVITLRGIGEMVGDKTSPDPQNRIASAPPKDALDYGQNTALVRLEASPKDASDPRGDKDILLWKAMDDAAEEVARMLAGGGPIQYLSHPNAAAKAFWQDAPPGRPLRQDTLSSTHHEGGTLWMGDAPETSVTDEWGRFWESPNLYALGPCLLPTLGSPNPMLSGVALTRRTADHLFAFHAPAAAEAGFEFLFDGTEKTFGQWQMAGDGAFALVDGSLVAQPGGNIGLLYFAPRQFGDFTLHLKFRLARPTGDNNDNSGVFVRFRDPRRPVPPGATPYVNQAFVAVHTGFEVQIDDEARGDKSQNPPETDGADKSRTGAIYKVPTGQNGEPKEQDYRRENGPVIAPNRWYDYEIEVLGDTYTVRLKEEETPNFPASPLTTFKKGTSDADKTRGLSPREDPHSGYIGVQVHTGNVAFRDIRIKAAPAAVP